MKVNCSQKIFFDHKIKKIIQADFYDLKKI